MSTTPVPRWVITESPAPAVADRLSHELQLPRALTALLAQRGYESTEAAKAFLRPSLDQLSDPYTLHGMEAAVDALVVAVKAGKRILVHGDYDVDGQCATTVLTRALAMGGADVVPFVPHRMRDGYDFGPAGLAEAQRVKASVILTCDCGITAVDTVRAATDVGVQVIVTDHHLPGPTLPDATAVVNPQQPSDDSGLGNLCGTGVAFKLVQALAPKLGVSEHTPWHLLDLVALATVADVVPLTGENRILVKHGIRLMQTTRWPGLRALLQSAGLGGKELRAGQLAFVLGPRLNAAGRIGDAGDGLRLLLTDEPDVALQLAEQLERQNTERQALDRQMLDDAIAMVDAAGDPVNSPAYVLAAEGWHPGVVGIVASRIVERYGRPTFLIGLDGEVGKGSGRSISRFDLHQGLTACGDLLERFGGHRMAAGLTIRADQVDAFRERFQEAVAAAISPNELGPEQRVDLEIDLPEVTDDLERWCRHLEPCGMGNPGPVFGVRGVELGRRTVVGSGHLKGELQGHGQQLAAIGFQLADRVPWLSDAPIDAAFRLERNEFRGRSTLQARLLALAPHQSG